ncbi:hypothetical protein SAE02_36390 [Skermanella aerolata]|uniref:Uncharacterized protein n=1 Tax=Skermanella aerolata TaxID=393310 RepID=A0A512DSM8_9PROT|nr:hypothetical protein [Skermanella aerolata]KJB96169.1 hypothetical protein N826_37970 [Skermanella aerolata KACC 11604]GEO39491.1 hypothetical protein SAE02_36390 [Skermanella aerolata]
MVTSELLGKIRTGLYDFLAESPEERPALISPPSQAIRRSPAAPPAPEPSPLLGAELARLFARNPNAAAGRIHLIGLEPIRERLGERWPKLRDSIHQLASKVIGQHLGPDDVFCRYGTLDYLIAFSALTPEAARIKSVAIAQALYGHFLGSDDLEGITIKTAVGQIDGAIVFDQQPLHGILNALADLSPVPVDDKLCLRPRSDPTTLLEWQYRPVLDRQHGVLSTWCCVPFIRPPVGLVKEGYRVLGRDADADRIAELDRITLDHALRDLDDLIANRFSVFVNVPLHFENLCTRRTRAGVLGLLQQTDEMLRRFLVFTIQGAPGDIPRGRLLELASMLRPFCRSVLLAADPHDHSVAYAKECGIHGVTFDLGGQFDAAGHLPPALEKICRNVEHSGVRLAMIGIRTDAQAQLAADLGATYLGGPRIGPPGEAPANMVRYGWNDLMAGRCPL